MREFKHKGCESVVWRYVGPGDATPDMVSAYWEFADGTHPLSGSMDMRAALIAARW